MQTTELSLTSFGLALDTSEHTFGELRDSSDIAHNDAALRQRMAEDGYCFLRNYLDKGQVHAARIEIIRRLVEQELLDLNYPAIDAITNPTPRTGKNHEALSKNNRSLHELLYTGRMIALYERLLGGPVRHFDFTWFRAVPGGGQGIYPHCDIVYMGRGTFNLFTAWTPIGDVPLELGGLMILEGSHRQADRLRSYLSRDVDRYCTNYPDAGEIESGSKQWQDWDGRLSSSAATLCEKLGGRWLTTNFEAGDVLTFGMATVHASLDNHTNRFRLSSDSRYQLASDPVDERWIGEDPIAHGPAGKKGKVC